MKANIYLMVTLGSTTRDDPKAAAFFMEVPVDLSPVEDHWVIGAPDPPDGTPIPLAIGATPAYVIGRFISRHNIKIDELVKRGQEILDEGLREPTHDRLGYQASGQEDACESS